MVSTADLCERVAHDAEWVGCNVAIERRGRLTIIFGDPDWIDDETLFTTLRVGRDHDMRAPVYLTAFASLLVTQRRGSQPVVLIGSCSIGELALVQAKAAEHDRVVAFACEATAP
jgi:hypothetical protein